MKKRIKYIVPLLLCGSLLFTGCKPFSNAFNGTGNKPNNQSASNVNNQEFDDYLNDSFEESVVENTINLHYTLHNPSDFGIDDYEVTLGDFSKESRNEYSDEIEESLEELHEFDYDSLSAKQQIDYDVLEEYLSNNLELDKYSLYEEYLSPNNGYQSQLPVLLAEYDFNSVQDVDDYLALLKDIPRFYGEIMVFEHEKSEAGLFMSDLLCNQVIESCQSFIANPEENILITTFDNKISNVPGITDAEINYYKNLNSTYVNDYVFPAYQDMIDDLTGLLGTGKNDLGLYYFPDGADYYELKVQDATGCSDSIDEMYKDIEEHRTDLELQMALIYQKNNNIFDDCENCTLDYDNEEEMLESLQDSILEDFPKIENTDYTVSYVDDSLQDSLAPAFYLTAPIDNYEHNKIYINPSSSMEGIQLFTTLAHEGYPGHLYQTVMSYNYGLTPIRSLISCNGYTEGWATYIEMISYSYAGLDEDISSFLQINADYNISLYATCDIGLNYYGWTHDQLKEFWAPYGITDDETINELETLLLSDPGNYLNYYVGYLQFEELKDSQEDALGNDYSDVDFHRTILEIGPASFDVIDKHFETVYYK